ncbi:hypothetical protein [Leptothoe sp. PORK10 BA2]|uniref:hypothetical protein n=1 Tax=Leptothoe sp. PORK10 BA2 TaxID=3110254 RepID=UPI002B213E93|nr:hypothetical protein [Leptothoe sp. PORK10 BA2]MEA5463988.1 hypothetical protein [Leptothoe sp. PORK10 BA2]
MDIQERINRQRVHHIVASYQLDGDDGDVFAECLAQLLETYPQSLIELSLLESIVKGWSEMPMPRGMLFIQGVHERLRSWQPELEIPTQPSSPLKTLNPKFLGVMSLDVKASASSSIAPESIGITITPGQFEQITGLDASLVFDGHGHVLLTHPVEMRKPLEPQQ